MPLAASRRLGTAYRSKRACEETRPSAAASDDDQALAAPYIGSVAIPGGNFGVLAGGEGIRRGFG